MRRFGLALIVAATALTMAQAARAADVFAPPAEPEVFPSWYLRGDIGWSFLEWSGGDDDDAIAAGVGVGYRFSPAFRADIRGDFAGDYNIGGGADMDVWTVLANGYFDIPTGTMITPYLGAGIGWGFVNESPGPNDDGVAFALMGGASIDLSQTTAIDIGYRFRDVMISGSDTQEHQILGGIRFSF
jgi:opacity protein-like surface antigen